jgi:hypothetical protein
LETQRLVSHEINAVTKALIVELHLNHQTEAVNYKEQGYIIVPKKKLEKHAG